MKAKFVFEDFKRGQDPRKSMDIGYNRKMDTKSWKILDFIAEAGKDGRSFTEIQKFIFVDLNKHSEEDFYKKSKGAWKIKKGEEYWDTEASRSRASRGYWATPLYNVGGGLLNKYCKKNDLGKWVLVRFPDRNENIYDKFS